jgi:hypothetical protein
VTLVIAFSHPHFAVMASDRLVTLASGVDGRYLGDHNSLANKTLILVTEDAAVAIGYCGSAYVAGRLTDDWIADTITAGEGVFGRDGTPGMIGLKARSELRLHQICRRLRRGLAASAGGRGVTIMMVGWRLRRQLITPITLVFRASDGLGAEPGLTMRPRWPLQSTFQWIGAQPTPTEFNAAFRDHAANGALFDDDRVVALLTDVIRRKASTDATVGPHVMSVTLHRPGILRRALCCFDPLEGHYGKMKVEGVTARSPVAYSPWILTPTMYQAPTEMSGTPGDSAYWMADGWRFEMKDVPRSAPIPSNVGWAAPSPRPPAPAVGRRPRR